MCEKCPIAGAPRWFAGEWPAEDARGRLLGVKLGIAGSRWFTGVPGPEVVRRSEVDLAATIRERETLTWGGRLRITATRDEPRALWWAGCTTSKSDAADRTKRLTRKNGDRAPEERPAGTS